MLRIWGIDFGLPHIYHTDEWFEVKRALKLGAGVFDFERVSKGGYFYLLFVEYGIYYAILKILGLVKSGDEFLFNLFRDPTNMWLIGRVTTAIIGTLNCWFVYLLGKHAFSKTVGLFAALLLAIHLIHVKCSHFITVDVPLTCFITICFLIMFWNSSKPKFTKLHYCLLGFFVAFAIMTKIPGAVIFFPGFIFNGTVHVLALHKLPSINITLSSGIFSSIHVLAIVCVSGFVRSVSKASVSLIVGKNATMSKMGVIILA